MDNKRRIYLRQERYNNLTETGVDIGSIGILSIKRFEFSAIAEHFLLKNILIIKTYFFKLFSGLTRRECSPVYFRFLSQFTYIHTLAFSLGCCVTRFWKLGLSGGSTYIFCIYQFIWLTLAKKYPKQSDKSSKLFNPSSISLYMPSKDLALSPLDSWTLYPVQGY